MTWRLNRWLLILALLIGLPYYWLLLDNHSGDVAAKPVTMTQLRALAGSIPGKHPARIEAELVSWRRLPGNFFAAGSGLKRVAITIMAWQLPVEGGKPVVIDSGITAKDAAAMDMEGFLPDRQAKIEAALDHAGLILFTHEHPDHLGPYAARRDFPNQAAVLLNPAQLEALDGLRKDGMKTAVEPGHSMPTTPFAVAPGIVVIPAPSHTPGSQMIFVQLADGREVLFAGDIATLARSWQQQRARSRLIGDWFAPENRAEVYAWLKTIAALKREAPALLILPGHDGEWLFKASSHAGVTNGFSQTGSSQMQHSN